MVFPSCSSVSPAGVGSGCVINIVYNEQLPLCSSAMSPATDKERNRICRRPEELCTSDPNFKFDMRTEGDNDVGYCSLLYSFASIIYYTPGIRTDTTLRPSSHLPRELSSGPRYHILSSPTFAHQAWRRKLGWLPGPPIDRP